MSNKGIVIRECERANAVRRVCIGKVDSHTFFHNIRGPLLMSGTEAGNRKMLADMVEEYARRKDMPTIVLSGHLDFLKDLQRRRVLTFAPGSLKYHPLYGMSDQQICRLIRAAGEEVGVGGMMDRVLLYATSVINIVAAKYPVSLPAISALLKEDDDFIASFAYDMGLSNITADCVLANCAEGIMFRRIIERMEEVFEAVALSENDTKNNFQSANLTDRAVMSFYQTSSNQRLMNLYLKEELFAALKKMPKLRVILEEVQFINEKDELLTWLFQMKRQGKIELIAVSQNVGAMLAGADLDFANVCLFSHENPVTTEKLSKELFGTYRYHYPGCVTGRPAVVLMTLKKDMHWQMSTEERLKVRAEDLNSVPRIFGSADEYLAVRTTSNNNIYLVPVGEFLASCSERKYAIL